MEATLKDAMWLESARENFQEALANELYSLAGSIIHDVKEKGFVWQAKVMAFELRNIQFSPKH